MNPRQISPIPEPICLHFNLKTHTPALSRAAQLKDLERERGANCVLSFVNMAAGPFKVCGVAAALTRDERAIGTSFPSWVFKLSSDLPLHR